MPESLKLIYLRHSKVLSLYTDIILYVFCFFLAVQLFYYFYYFLCLNYRKEVFNIKEHKPISIVVCTHNELDNLKKLIPSLLNQNYHHFEIVIVNDRSFDGTFDYLEQQRKIHPKIKVVQVEENPKKMDAKKYALTLGIKAASNEYIIFTDADCMPVSQNWLLQVQSKFSGKIQLVIGVSQYEVKKGLLNLLIRFETLYTAMQYISFAMRGAPYMGIGRNLAYTKSLFFDNKGFHPYMSVVGGDDDIFINRVATKDNAEVVFSIDSQTISIPKTTWKEWFRQKIRHLSVSKYYNGKTKFMLAMLNFSHIMFYVFAVVLFFYKDYFIFSIVTIYIRWIILVVVFSLCAKKLRYKISTFKVVIFDLFYLFYYLIVGIQALRTREIKWK